MIVGTSSREPCPVLARFGAPENRAPHSDHWAAVSCTKVVGRRSTQEFQLPGATRGEKHRSNSVSFPLHSSHPCSCSPPSRWRRGGGRDICGVSGLPYPHWEKMMFA